MLNLFLPILLLRTCTLKKLIGYYLLDLGDGILFADMVVAGIDFLKRNGFGEPGIESRRMVLGEDMVWIPQCHFSRIGGNFG